MGRKRKTVTTTYVFKGVDIGGNGGKRYILRGPNPDNWEAQEGVMDEREVAGVRRAITWLHEEAKRMNDPHARSVLNDAAFHLGTQLGRWRGKWPPLAAVDPPEPDDTRPAADDFVKLRSE